jgi:hypothetical protein
MKNVKKIVILLLLCSLALSLEFPQLKDSDGETYDLKIDPEDKQFYLRFEDGGTRKSHLVYDISVNAVLDDDFKMTVKTVKLETGVKRKLTLQLNEKNAKVENQLRELKKELHLGAWRLENTDGQNFRAYIGVDLENGYLINWNTLENNFGYIKGKEGRKAIKNIEINAKDKIMDLHLDGTNVNDLPKNSDVMNELWDLVDHVGGKVIRSASFPKNSGADNKVQVTDFQFPIMKEIGIQSAYRLTIDPKDNRFYLVEVDVSTDVEVDVSTDVEVSKRLIYGILLYDVNEIDFKMNVELVDDTFKTIELQPVTNAKGMKKNLERLKEELNSRKWVTMVGNIKSLFKNSFTGMRLEGAGLLVWNGNTKKMEQFENSNSSKVISSFEAIKHDDSMNLKLNDKSQSVAFWNNKAKLDAILYMIRHVGGEIKLSAHPSITQDNSYFNFHNMQGIEKSSNTGLSSLRLNIFKKGNLQGIEVLKTNPIVKTEYYAINVSLLKGPEPYNGFSMVFQKGNGQGDKEYVWHSVDNSDDTVRYINPTNKIKALSALKTAMKNSGWTIDEKESYTFDAKPPQSKRLLKKK